MYWYAFDSGEYELVIEKDEIEFLLNCTEAVSFALDQSPNPSNELLDTEQWCRYMIDFISQKTQSK